MQPASIPVFINSLLLYSSEVYEYPFYQLLLGTLRFATGTGTGISQSLAGKAIQTLIRLLGSEEKKKNEV